MAQAHNPSQPPPGSWDDELAQSLIGKLILVGVTYVTADSPLAGQAADHCQVELISRPPG